MLPGYKSCKKKINLDFRSEIKGYLKAGGNAEKYDKLRYARNLSCVIMDSERESMGFCLSWLTVKILTFLRLAANFLPLRRDLKGHCHGGKT